MFYRFFYRKPLPGAQATAAEQRMPRTIGLLALTLIGVGSTLGTGIFFAMAETVPIAGPAVVLSFVLAALTAGLTALCFAEVATLLPVSGSSYTFTYVTLGEGAAMLVAACLLLEWGIAGAAVAVGWSAYLNQLLEMLFGSGIPAIWREPPFEKNVAGLIWGGQGWVNLPAIAVVWLSTLLLLRGSQASARLNAVLTALKIGVLLLFVLMTLTVFRADHFTPFMPFGVAGVSAGAAIIFFSFVGLDSVINASEEAINPKRNIPTAICLALVIVTVVYLAVAISSLGVQPFERFIGHHGALPALLLSATQSPQASILLAIGAVVSIFSVTLLTLFGQARVYFAMARDGLLPSKLARLHPKTRGPQAATLLAAVMITPVAGLLPSHVLWGMVSLGTLMAFIAVAVTLIVLRQRQAPGTTVGFRVPGYPYTPLLSIASCVYLIANLSATVFTLFAIWLTIAMLFYAAFGQRSAKQLARRQGKIAT